MDTEHCGQLCVYCALYFALNNNSASCPYLIVHIKWYALFIYIFLSVRIISYRTSYKCLNALFGSVFAILFILYMRHECFHLLHSLVGFVRSIQSILKIVFILPSRLHAFAFAFNSKRYIRLRSEPLESHLKTMVAELHLAAASRAQCWTHRRIARTRIKMHTIVICVQQEWRE